jgi:BirA family biotin operon repressor/biotin-[acetyl-CoA-carboxylase] ligase
MTNNKLKANAMARELDTHILGRRVVYLEQTASTNDVARELAEAGEPEGTLIIADEQTAGRGRLGRAWIAPSCSSILMSLILRPNLAPAHIARVTMAVSLGACDAIYTETGLNARIKWPNDILLNEKKCAGILSEASTVGDQVEYVIVGLGMNVNFSAATIPNIPADATTLADELNKPVARESLVQAILRATEPYYAHLNSGRDLRDAWKSRLAMLGQHVRAQTAHGIEEGIAEDVDSDGALIVRRADGSPVRLVAGDVTLRINDG